MFRICASRSRLVSNSVKLTRPATSASTSRVFGTAKLYPCHDGGCASSSVVENGQALLRRRFHNGFLLTRPKRGRKCGLFEELLSAWRQRNHFDQASLGGTRNLGGISVSGIQPACHRLVVDAGCNGETITNFISQREKVGLSQVDQSAGIELGRHSSIFSAPRLSSRCHVILVSCPGRPQQTLDARE